MPLLTLDGRGMHGVFLSALILTRANDAPLAEKIKIQRYRDRHRTQSASKHVSGRLAVSDARIALPNFNNVPVGIADAGIVAQQMVGQAYLLSSIELFWICG